MSFHITRPTLMRHFYTLNAILQPPHTMRRVDVVLAATPNQASSGRLRGCTTSTINNDIITLMLCPAAISAPTLMRHFYAYNAILRAPHTMRRVDVMPAATPNQASSGRLRGCTTSTINNDIITLMLCPSALSAPNLMGYFYAYNAILRAQHTTRR